jgi:hypothetical protein
MHLLIAFLIFLVILVVVCAIVIFILSQLPGVPPWARNLVLAVGALVLLIWLVENAAGITNALHG